MQQTQQKNEVDIEQISRWVEGAAAGNEPAFAQLYQAYHKRLYLFCKRMSSDVGAAEEAVQESFVKAWNGLSNFRQESAFYTWLRQIASRVMIDKMRLKEANVWRNVSEIEENTIFSQTDQSIGLDLEKMIQLLPVNARSIFVLHDVEGYTHKEIAKEMNIAEGTSKAQLSRARSLLREALSTKSNSTKSDLNKHGVTCGEGGHYE